MENSRCSYATSVRAVVTALLGLVALSIGCQPAAAPRVASLQPPRAEKVAKLDTLHGQQRADEYFWLRDRSNPKVLDYLRAENDYTAAMMRHTEPLQKKLYDEMLARIKETDLSVPVKVDDYFYYSRTVAGKQYAIHCRKQGSLDATDEQVLLDENELAEGHDFFSIGAFVVSPDRRQLAYSTDTSGDEQFTLHFKDLSTGVTRDETIQNTAESVIWAADNRTVFYTTRDATNRPFRTYRHTLGDDPQRDSLVYEEPDEAFYMGLGKTSSKQYLLMVLESNTTTEVRYLSAESPLGEFQVMQPRQPKIEYRVDHHSDRFYIVTNDNALNFRLMTAPLDAPGKASWQELIPHRADVKLESVKLFAGHIVLVERVAGVPTLSVRDLATGQTHAVEFPEAAYAAELGENREFNTTTLRFTYTSLVTPRSVFDYDMQTKTRVLRKQEEVLGGYDPDQYQTERIFATAKDRTRVPMSLVYKKGLNRNGRSAALLYGYGAYGISEDPYFDSTRLSLLDRGFVFAIAHVRGGGEMGRAWYDNGKLRHKPNTFTDFIACAEHLIAEKYTSHDRLAITGGSAGGLLMGAVTNMRPDLFRVVVADVPFVDVVNTMLDATIPLTVTEYEEWGNPNERPFYDIIQSYSPYDNVQAKYYPHMLVLAGLNDTRVGYWEPAKWTARLRALKTDDNLLLLHTNMEAGHSGASGRYDYLKELALQYAFILDRLDVRQ
jgi:oligopeptidase B